MGLKDGLLLRVAKRWIAGVDLDSAIKDAKRANEKGMGAIVNFLGEEVTQPALADSHLQQYISLQEAMRSNQIKGSASVKLTQFALGTDDAGASRRLESAANNAEKLNQLLWIDMEGSKFTDRTLEIYSDSLAKHATMGVALQAYLRRSEKDLKALLDKGGRVRLVKGAYREPREISYPTRQEVNENYSALMKALFEQGDHFAIATHNSKLIEEARRLADQKHVDFEFEMLKGIRNEMKEELVKSGYRVSEYLPYGSEWYAYSQRRLSEHPSNIILLVRSLF
jgi:proline dehydrogenase